MLWKRARSRTVYRHRHLPGNCRLNVIRDIECLWDILGGHFAMPHRRLRAKHKEGIKQQHCTKYIIPTEREGVLLCGVRENTNRVVLWNRGEGRPVFTVFDVVQCLGQFVLKWNAAWRERERVYLMHVCDGGSV